jgi:hypothetical protein
MWESNNKHRALVIRQVTLSLVRLIEALVSQPTQVLDSVEERSPGGGGRAGIWHSLEIAQ